MQMAASAENSRVRTGDGWAAAHVDAFGDGPGFRKVRRALGVTAFGVNAIVLPPGTETGFHYHDRQEELYFVHRGTIEMEFGDGSREELTEGAFARVDAPTPRRIHNRGDVDAVYVIVGGKDGYVGRDGQVPPGEEQRVRALHDLGGSS
jgi:mannose-6-phosphate isomerase-like protein (cupin superfamily)